MTIIVTGASGFIGSHIAETLAKEGHTVRACYRSKPHSRIGNNPGITWHKIDLKQDKYDSSLFEDARGIVHAAAMASDWGSRETFLESNLHPVEKLVKQSKEHNLSWMVFISSISVHGFGDHRNSTEEGPYFNHDSHYQASKLMAEEDVLKANSDKFRTNIIRPGNVYGPDDINVSYTMFDFIYDKNTMMVVDHGKALTCPVYIDDLVSACIKLINSDTISGEIFNITGGEQISWHESVTLMKQSLKKDAKIVNVSAKLGLFAASVLRFFYRLFRIRSAPISTKYRINQVSQNYTFSIEKAKKMLGYNPKTQYKEGIAITADAYIKRKSNGHS